MAIYYLGEYYTEKYPIDYVTYTSNNTSDIGSTYPPYNWEYWVEYEELKFARKMFQEREKRKRYLTDPPED